MIADPSPLRPRQPPVAFEQGLTRHWLGGQALPTHIANAVNLLFPAGERFFIRSVARYADRVEDPALRAQVRAFFGQEGHHAKAHERFFDLLREQGYEIDRFLRAYERIAYDGIERLCSPELRLSATAALEHYTAILAEEALQEGTLDLAHPTARALLLWHAAEEIEHKAVAFDVLKAIDPSYRLRMRGFALATSTLAMFWLAALLVLLVQELPRRGEREREKSTERIPPVRRRFIVRRVFLRGAREYVRRDFHPSQNDNLHLARAYLAGIGVL
ncbi:metal-dependent hydrolase [Sorangium atrum]|uniref:Metal-dependent hydrolase n=1 Tax=Sorangium atrum TaxID=2995308 RepID=A0ABT5CGD7_9BACT|nr:metal-dependent hydrolase [Sorangium aterium]MDC0685008.1 metal-dependent hydrolase [Sorangium aterium]